MQKAVQMENLKINVEIDRHGAVMAGSAKYGYATISPTDAQLTELSQEERVALLAYAWRSEGPSPALTTDGLIPGSPCATLRYHARAQLTGPLSWEETVAAVRRDLCLAKTMISEMLAKKERDAVEREAKVRAQLAMSFEDALTVEWGTPHVRLACEDDPRVRLKIAEWQPQINEVRVARFLETGLGYGDIYVADDPCVIAEMERRERIAAGAKAMDHLSRAVWAAKCCEYAEKYIPEYARAARDRRDVSCSVVKEIKRRVCDALASQDLKVVETYKEREQETPCAHAYETLDSVRAVVDALDADTRGMIDFFELEIKRGDLNPHDGTPQWRTVVRLDLILYSPDRDIEINVSAEEWSDVESEEDV